MRVLTVIVPCYNAHKYIDKCYRSLKNQTYNDFDIIFVDDCSTDDTYSIISSYRGVTILQNKTNSGAGYSRNSALKLVKTEYVTFLDADDYYDNDYLENMMKGIITEHADISICDIFLKYDVVTSLNVNTLVSCCEDDLTRDNYIINGLAASPCNKVFKTSLFSNNLFAEGIINEDIPAVITTLIRANKIAYVGNSHYNYIQHNTSVQNSSLSLKKLDIFKAIDLLICRNKGITETTYYDGIIFNQIILLLFYIVPKEQNNNNRMKFLKEYAKSIKKYDLKHNSYLTTFYKTQSKLHIKYYNILIGLISSGKYKEVSHLIGLYNYYKTHYTKNVLTGTYNIDGLVSLACTDKPIKDISVVIPNYNYSKFLYQRLYSILDQKYKVKELIILDDCSTDDSVAEIKKIELSLKKYINISVVINTKNSGSPFAQWRKGIDMATSKYIWITEADDYCDNHFLKAIFDKIEKDDKIVVVYANTAFINSNGFVIQRSVVPDIDILNTGHWNKDYINNGIDEISNYAYLNCTIANVSSVVFKRDAMLKVIDDVSSFKQAGDWLFYLSIMKQGNVAFISKALNYYRIHGSNATTTNKKQLQFDEIKRIHCILDNEYHLDSEQKRHINERYEFLKMKWKVR